MTSVWIIAGALEIYYGVEATIHVWDLPDSYIHENDAFLIQVDMLYTLKSLFELLVTFIKMLVTFLVAFSADRILHVWFGQATVSKT